MSRLLPLIACDEVPAGQLAEVVSEGRIYAVFHVEDQFHVLDGICPHAGGPLGKGTLQANVVTCPWHGWQFDVVSGCHELNETICQTRFATRIVDSMVCIERADEE